MTDNNIRIACCSALAGILIGMAAGLFLYPATQPPPKEAVLKVGDCVRLIGYGTVETITVVHKDMVETKYRAQDNKPILNVYSTADILVKEACRD